jgi:hypothetical protein
MDKRIAAINPCDGGFMVHLVNGYSHGGTETAQHCYWEETTAKVKKELKNVKPCSCAACKSGKVQW